MRATAGPTRSSSSEVTGLHGRWRVGDEEGARDDRLQHLAGARHRLAGVDDAGRWLGAGRELRR